MTPGSDYIIRLHVAEKQEVKGTILQDSDALAIAQTSTKIPEHGASITTRTWLRVPTRVSSRLAGSESLVASAVTDDTAFRTMVASTSRASISYPRTMSMLVSTPAVEGWTSRALEKQPTHMPTPAPAIGRVNNLPIWPPLLYALVALLAIAVWFSIIVYRINCCDDVPFRDRFSTLKRFFCPREEKISEGDTPENKIEDRKLHPIILHDGRPGIFSSSSLRIRESNRINTRKVNLRSASYTPPSPSSSTPSSSPSQSTTITSSLSPPQTPRAPSYSDFAPQATTTSSAYNTPTVTPLQPSFPNTTFHAPSSLRQRSHIPPSLIIRPASPSTTTKTTNVATGVDLEDQTPIPIPRFAALRPGSSGNLDGEGEKATLTRIGRSRWVAGVVDRVSDGVVRWTRDEGGDGEACLPINEW